VSSEAGARCCGGSSRWQGRHSLRGGAGRSEGNPYRRPATV
ncbi:MAG: hypothetical protein AVDCRST_MAG24-1867, partial [uncultured Nocardioidaceae bacterium]